MTSPPASPLLLQISQSNLASGDLDAEARVLATWVTEQVSPNVASVGAPIGGLTMREAVQPLVHGAPHGVYLVLLGESVLYVGSNTGRAFHDRLAGHLDPGAGGWFNSCVKAMVRSGEWSDTGAALTTLLDSARILFLPLGNVRTQEGLRTLILKAENRLRAAFPCLNRRSPGNQDEEAVAIEAVAERLQQAEDYVEQALRDAAEAEADADALGAGDVGTPEGEILYVKCGTTWPREPNSEAARQQSVLGNWKINHVRARSVRTVVGIAQGTVKAAWDVAPWDGVTVDDGRVRFQPVAERTDVDALLARLEGRTVGWTWTYRPA